MKIKFFLMITVLIGLSCSPTRQVFQEPTQMIVVITSDWDVHTATLQRYERMTPQSRWIRIVEPIPVVIGRNGLAWGRGMHPPNDKLVQKVEGDGKSPAGMFSLDSVFGYADAAEMKDIKMPYQQATKALHCVDDVESKYYNQVIDHTTVEMDWNSYEDMLRDDDVYRLGIIVKHNVNPCEPGLGSCIFIHIWSDAETGTAGCTAMSPENIETLIHWLDSEKHPVMVQLPGFMYDQVRDEWNLP